MKLESLPKRIDKIDVCLGKKALGLLTNSSVHHYQPSQIGQYVSLTMTRPSLDGYSSGALHPIFAQNLPEGFNRHFIAERLARYAKVDDMYLLALQGADGIRMLSYEADVELPEVGSIPLDEILEYQGKEPLFPQLLEKYYLRNSLSGVQPKVSILNTERTENLETFVVERFDKPEGRLMGYEDFTTLMKRPNSPDAKYIGSYESLLEATHLYTRNLEEVFKMYRYIVFNSLIGNGDAHLKNFALQYTPDMQQVFVSPPFDITHTLIYDTIDNKMALKLKGSKSFPDKKHLIDLATSKSFRLRGAEAIIDNIADGILDYLKRSDEVYLLDGLKASITQSVSRAMALNSKAQPYRHDKKRKFE